jgi:hypothetical protein
MPPVAMITGGVEVASMPCVLKDTATRRTPSH